MRTLQAVHWRLLMLVVLWMTCSTKVVKKVEAHQFCSRTDVACAKPPTVDDLQVEKYLGQWYEVGSTASFKLLTEAGLACDQARYTSSRGNLSLLNSGLRVINSLAVAEVGAINVAARGICGSARVVCTQLAGVHQLSQSFNNLTLHSSTNKQKLVQLADNLATSANSAQQTLQGLAEDVSRIQQENGQISQANYSSARSLQSSVGAINEYVKEAGKEQGAIATLASNLNKIRAQVWEMQSNMPGSEQSKLALEQASLALGSIALKVGASSAAIDVGLKAVGTGANALLKNGEPIEDGRVSSVTGTITQPSATSAGKLEVRINGAKAPYWIIAVERSKAGGEYTAALVYSCSQVAGVIAKSLFVLSREPQLQQTTVDAFLAKAQSLGIYTDCEDPFLPTLQRGGTCGHPSSST